MAAEVTEHDSSLELVHLIRRQRVDLVLRRLRQRLPVAFPRRRNYQWAVELSDLQELLDILAQPQDVAVEGVELAALGGKALDALGLLGDLLPLAAELFQRITETAA